MLHQEGKDVNYNLHILNMEFTGSTAFKFPGLDFPGENSM